jgi:peptide/nickel transport system ATP-binding protein
VTPCTFCFAGRVVESGPVATVLGAPAHPYTIALRAAVPRLGTAHRPADRPDALPATDGCPYRHRCPIAIDRCATEAPDRLPVADDHYAACHRADHPTEPIPPSNI